MMSSFAATQHGDLGERVSALEAQQKASDARQDRTDDAVSRLDKRIFQLLVGVVLVLLTALANLALTLSARHPG